MRVIGIETSCDETGIAIYDDKAGYFPMHFTVRWNYMQIMVV